MSKTKNPEMISQEQLSRQIVRVVLVAPDIDPRTGQAYAHEVAVVKRPGWGKDRTAIYKDSLIGGRIEKARKIKDKQGHIIRTVNDFKGVVSPEESQNPKFIFTPDQIIQAGLNAAAWHVLDELELTLAPGLLQFVDVSTNQEEWTSYAYVAQLPEKPTLIVKPNSAGSGWINVDKILNGNPRLLSGHLGLTRQALKKIG